MSRQPGSAAESISAGALDCWYQLSYKFGAIAVFMPQLMTRSAERDEVFFVICAALSAGDDMVDVQMSGVAAALASALVAVAG